MLNTRINYLYRDGSNYKQHNAAVVSGELSDADKETIIGCLYDGEYFIPSMVGIEEHRVDDKWTEDDHCWFELHITDLEDTAAAPTTDMTSAELVQRFLQCKGKWEDGVHDTNNPSLCPHCGGNLEYQNMNIRTPNGKKSLWKCDSCGKEGWAVFNMETETTFVRHEDEPLAKGGFDQAQSETTTNKTPHTIWVKPSCFAPEFKMIIDVPNDWDTEEYINELLDGILNDDLRYNCEWDFV